MSESTVSEATLKQTTDVAPSKNKKRILGMKNVIINIITIVRILVLAFSKAIKNVPLEYGELEAKKWYPKNRAYNFLGNQTKRGAADQTMLWNTYRRVWYAWKYFGHLRAPITWRIGAGSHDGQTMVISPILSRLWTKVTHWIAWKLIIRQKLTSNQIEDISRSLFGEWWYQSASPEFGWLSWAISLKRKMRQMPCGRQQARRQEARIN